MAQVNFFFPRVLPKIPVSKEIDPLLEIDRNPRKLEIFLNNHVPSLTVKDLRMFLPCTINVDPYLRKLISGMCKIVTFNLNTYFCLICFCLSETIFVVLGKVNVNSLYFQLNSFYPYRVIMVNYYLQK